MYSGWPFLRHNVFAIDPLTVCVESLKLGGADVCVCWVRVGA